MLISGSGTPGCLPPLYLQLAFDLTDEGVAPQPLSFTVTNSLHGITAFVTAITGRASA
jgi:hypothetical protein